MIEIAFISAPSVGAFNSTKRSHRLPTRRSRICSQRQICTSLAARRTSRAEQALSQAIDKKNTVRIPKLLEDGLSPLSTATITPVTYYSAVSACMLAADYSSLARVLHLGLSSRLIGNIQYSHLTTPLYALARARQWKSVFTLLDCMAGAAKNNPTLIPNARLLVSLANIAANLNAYSQSLRFFDWMTKNALEFGPHAYSVMFKAHGRATNIIAVNSVLNKVKESGITVDTVLLNSAIDALVRCDRVRAAHQLLLNQTYTAIVDATTYNTVIKGYAVKGQASQAFSLASRMQDSGLNPTPATINTLLSACVAATDFDTAWELLKMYTNPQPSRFSTLPTLSRPPSPTPELRQALLSSSSPPNTHRLNSESGNAPASDPVTATEQQTISDRALSFREALNGLVAVSKDQTDIVASSTKYELKWIDQFRIAYTTLLSGLAECGRFDDVFALLEDMRDKDIPPNSVTYASLISSCLKQGKVDKAKQIFESIPTSNEFEHQNCDIHVYFALISGLCRLENENYINTALGLIEELTGDCSERAQDCEEIAHISKSDSVPNGFSIKVRDKVVPNVQMFNAILEGFMQIGFPARAEKVLKMMKRVRVLPNTASYTILMKGYADAGRYRSAKRIFRELWQDGLRPDRVAFNAFISICARSGDFEAGEKVLSYMEKHRGSVSPTAHSYISLIRGYGRFGTEEQMWDAYKRMRDAKVPLNDFGLKVIADDILNRASKQKDASIKLDKLAERSGCLLRDGLNDGASITILRQYKNKLLSVFNVEQRRRYFGGLDSEELRSASEAIFERHGWNDIDSGWRVF